MLVGKLELCRINGGGKHRDLSGYGESRGIDASSGGKLWVLVSLYVILYACTMSIRDTRIFVDTVFRFTPADFEKQSCT